MTGTATNKYYRGATGLTHASLNGTMSYYQKDAHGDITALANAAGEITKNYLYDAFGDEQNVTENDNNPFRYCGEYFDNEIDMIYLRNRYYDTAIGRFVTEDPIKDGLNWYTYCENNPVMFVDPEGEGTKPLTLLREFKLTSSRIGNNKSRKANKLGNISEANAIIYAENNNLYIDGELQTWQNAADAKRHMDCNARMVAEIGYDEAQIVGNNHELAYLRELGLVKREAGSLVFTYMYQDTVMDLRNNAIGRNLMLNPKLKRTTYDEKFEYAKNKGLLITDANRAYDYFGIADLANELNQISVCWDVEDDTISVWNSKTNRFESAIRLGE